MASPLDRVARARRPEAAARLVALGSVDATDVRRAAMGCRACPLWERATQTVFGAGPRDHGRLLESEIAPIVTATIHPSAVLRSRTRAERDASLDGLVDDLRSTIALLEARPRGSWDRPATEQVGRRRGHHLA